MADRHRNTPDGPIRQVAFLSIGIRASEEVTEEMLSRARAGLSDATGMDPTRIAVIHADAPAAGDDIAATVELPPGIGINSQMFQMPRYREEFADDPAIDVTGVFVSAGDPDEALLAQQKGGGRM